MGYDPMRVSQNNNECICKKGWKRGRGYDQKQSTLTFIVRIYNVLENTYVCSNIDRASTTKKHHKQKRKILQLLIHDAREILWQYLPTLKYATNNKDYQYKTSYWRDNQIHNGEGVRFTYVTKYNKIGTYFTKHKTFTSIHWRTMCCRLHSLILDKIYHYHLKRLHNLTIM